MLAHLLDCATGAQSIAILHCFRVGMFDIPMRHFQLVRTKPSLYVPVLSCCNRSLVLHCPKWIYPVGEEGMWFIHTSATIFQCVYPRYPYSSLETPQFRMRGTVVQRIISWFCPVTLFFRCRGILTTWSWMSLDMSVCRRISHAQYNSKTMLTSHR